MDDERKTWKVWNEGREAEHRAYGRCGGMEMIDSERESAQAAPGLALYCMREVERTAFYRVSAQAAG